MIQSENPAMKKLFLYLLFCSLCHETVAQLLPSKTPAKKPAAPVAAPKAKSKAKETEIPVKPAESIKSDKQGIILITCDINAELYVNGEKKDMFKAGEPYTLKLSKGTYKIKVESINFELGDSIENFRVETGEELKPWYIMLKDKEVEIWNNRMSKLLNDAIVPFVRAENYYDKDDVENQFILQIKNNELNYNLITTRNPNAKLISLKSTTVRQFYYKIKPEDILRFQFETIQRPYTRFYGTSVLLKIYGAATEKTGTYGLEKTVESLSIPIKSTAAEALLKELQLLQERKPTAFIK